jgi:hypothetical protein
MQGSLWQAGVCGDSWPGEQLCWRRYLNLGNYICISDLEEHCVPAWYVGPIGAAAASDTFQAVRAG